MSTLRNCGFNCFIIFTILLVWRSSHLQHEKTKTKNKSQLAGNKYLTDDNIISTVGDFINQLDAESVLNCQVPVTLEENNAFIYKKS